MDSARAVTDSGEHAEEGSSRKQKEKTNNLLMRTNLNL